MNTKPYLKLTLLLGSIVVLLFGCQRDILNPANSLSDKNSQNVEVSTLKTYLATVLTVKEEAIDYNASTEEFRAFGVDQISKADLTNLYLHPLKIAVAKNVVAPKSNK